MRYRSFAALAGAAAILLGAAFSAAAQESGSDLSSLFGDEVLILPGQDQSGTTGTGQSTGQASSSASTAASGSAAPASDPLAGLLKTEAVRIGGSISGSVDSSWTWTDPWSAGFDPLNPDSHKLNPSLSSLVYFDARPEDAFRVHGSFKTAWPFSSTKTFLTSTTLSGSITAPNISVFELFSDFQLGDTVNLRFGKATVKWGVGYFFSPADIVNLEQINIQDPTAQREGPIQFRVFIPYGSSQNTLSFYAIFPNSATPDFANTALAGKAEFVLGNYELGLSAYYRNDTTERAAATLTGPAGPFDIFAEGVVGRGSPKTFYTAFTGSSPYYTAIDAATVRSTFYPSATAGFIYNDQNNNISAIGQYFYNGEGYSDTDRGALYSSYLAQSPVVQKMILYSIATGSIRDFPIFTGQHYGAASIRFSDIGSSDFSASALGILNISDLSGYVRPSVSWQIADYLQLALYTSFGFGAADSEYGLVFQGQPVTIGLTLTAGTGNF